MPEVEIKTLPDEEDRLCSIKETAELLGYKYRSLLQARVEKRVLLPEVIPSEGGHQPKYRLSDIRKVIRGEAKAMRASPFTDDAKRRAHSHSRTKKDKP